MLIKKILLSLHSHSLSHLLTCSYSSQHYKVTWVEEAENMNVGYVKIEKEKVMLENTGDWTGRNCDSSKPSNKNRVRCTEGWSGFQRFLWQLQLPLLLCKGYVGRMMSPTDQGTGGHLPQVMDQKAILVPMHLGTEPQLAPTSLSDLEGSSPGCVLRKVNLGTWVRAQEVEKEREENPINISIAKGWHHIL